MAARKRRRRKPGLLWRVLFGNNGPTRAELKKLLFNPKTFSLAVRDPATGKIRKTQMRLDQDGRLQEYKPPRKKKPAAKRQSKTTRGASQASKPSRASKTGAAPRRQTATAQSPARRGRPQPLAERVLRNPDGTLAGSRPVADPYVKAQREIEKAMRNAARADKRAEQYLGWRR